MLNLRLGICVVFLVQTLVVGASAGSDRLKNSAGTGLSVSKASRLLPEKTLRVQDKDQTAVEGRFDACTNDSLYLIVVSGTFAMPLEGVSKLWVRGSKAKTGLVIGLIAGGVFGIGAGALYGFYEGMEGRTGKSYLVPAGLAAGALVGGLVGYGIGAASRGWNLWYESEEDECGAVFQARIQPVYVVKDTSIGLSLSFCF